MGCQIIDVANKTAEGELQNQYLQEGDKNGIKCQQRNMEPDALTVLFLSKE